MATETQINMNDFRAAKIFKPRSPAAALWFEKQWGTNVWHAVNSVDHARCKKCEESGMVCSPLLDQLWCSRCNDSAVQPCSLIEEFKRWNAKRVLGISDEEYDELQQKDTTERQNKTISAPSLRGRKSAKSLANKDSNSVQSTSASPNTQLSPSTPSISTPSSSICTHPTAPTQKERELESQISSLKASLAISEKKNNVDRRQLKRTIEDMNHQHRKELRAKEREQQATTRTTTTTAEVYQSQKVLDRTLRELEALKAQSSLERVKSREESQNHEVEVRALRECIAGLREDLARRVGENEILQRAIMHAEQQPERPVEQGDGGGPHLEPLCDHVAIMQSQYTELCTLQFSLPDTIDKFENDANNFKKASDLWEAPKEHHEILGEHHKALEEHHQALEKHNKALRTFTRKLQPVESSSKRKAGSSMGESSRVSNRPRHT